MSEYGSTLRAGRVGRAHGLDGSFYVTRPLPRLLELGASVTIAGRVAAIVRRAGTDAHPIVRLEGVDDRAAAESLRGAEMTVAAQQAPTLEEGEWWAHELEGCTLRDGEREIGIVRRLVELPSCEALEVELADAGGLVLVPMVKDAIRRVDVGGREIDVDSAFVGLGEDTRTGERGQRGA